MKKYSAPVAEKVNFSYTDQVVASTPGGGGDVNCQHFLSDYNSASCTSFDGGWINDYTD